jgi:hypothetical protein
VESHGGPYGALRVHLLMCVQFPVEYEVLLIGELIVEVVAKRGPRVDMLSDSEILE